MLYAVCKDVCYVQCAFIRIDTKLLNLLSCYRLQSSSINWDWKFCFKFDEHHDFFFWRRSKWKFVLFISVQIKLSNDLLAICICSSFTRTYNGKAVLLLLFCELQFFYDRFSSNKIQDKRKCFSQSKMV